MKLQKYFYRIVNVQCILCIVRWVLRFLYNSQVVNSWKEIVFVCELTFQDLLLSRYIFWYLHIIVGPTLYQFPKKSLRKSIFTAYMIELILYI